MKMMIKYTKLIISRQKNWHKNIDCACDYMYIKQKKNKKLIRKRNGFQKITFECHQNKQGRLILFHLLIKK